MAFTIEKKDWNKIINYARARHAETKDEIGGMALVKPVPDTDDYRISHPVILKQVTSGGNCILDKDELANYYVDMALKHGNDIQFLWWHSHGNMEAFWSGTDTNTMTEYASGNWSVFLVVNIREEYKFRITCWEPQEMYIDTELEILGNNQRKIPTNITNEVSEKCTAYTYTYKNPIAVNKIKTKSYQQTSLLDDEWTEDDKAWNASFGINGYGSYGYQTYEDMELTTVNARSWACSAIEALNDSYMDGTLEYDDYVESIKERNDELRKAGSKVRIKCIGKGMLFQYAQTNYPFQFLENDDLTESIEEVTWQTS